MKLDALAISLTLIASSHHLAYHRLAPDMFEITGARGEDTDELRMHEASLACPKTGWESWSALKTSKNGSWRWVVRCRAVP